MFTHWSAVGKWWFKRLDVVDLILNPVMFADYQALMDDACDLFGYLDVALVAVCTENRAATKQGL